VLVNINSINVYEYVYKYLQKLKTNRKRTTRNSSGDEIANVNFLYDDIVHALQNTVIVFSFYSFFLLYFDLPSW